MSKFYIRQTKVASHTVHGPGSMFGEAEALKLAQQGKFNEAADLIELHNSLIPTGAQRIGQFIVDAWRAQAKGD